MTICLNNIGKVPYCKSNESTIPLAQKSCKHYGDVIMGEIASQITSLTIVYSAFFSDADQRNYQSSASLAFVNSPHKWIVSRKMFPFDDVIMEKIFVDYSGEHTRNNLWITLKVTVFNYVHPTGISDPKTHCFLSAVLQYLYIYIVTTNLTSIVL